MTAEEWGVAVGAVGVLVTVVLWLLDRRRKKPSPVREPTPFTGLPLDAVPSGYVEREDLAARAEALLGDSAVVLLHGMGGAGKSLLALSVAHRVAGRFPDGRLQLRLGGEHQPTLSAQEALDRLLRALDVPPDRVEGYRVALQGRRVLLLLDNVTGVDQVRPLLPRVPGCAVLLTSRDVLADLGDVKRVPVELLSPEEGLALLVRRVGAERVAAERAGALLLVERCGRLALAVALVAGRLALRPNRPLAHAVAELEDERRRLDPVQASFELSYQALKPDQARLFRLLGALTVPDIDAEATAALADLDVRTAQRLLDDLVDRSLAQLSGPTDDRYRLHDLLRLYAHDLLNDDEEREALDRALRWYRDRLQAADSWLDSSEDHPGPFGDRREALAWLDQHRPHLLALIEQSAGTGLRDHTIDLAWHLSQYLAFRMRWQDWHHTADLARRAAGPQPSAATLSNLGQAQLALDRPGEALQTHNQLLERQRATGDRRGEGMTLHFLGWALLDLGRTDEALRTYHQALDCHRDAGNRRGEAVTLTNVGLALVELDRADEALAAFQQALDLERAAGNRYGEGATFHDLGWALLSLDRGHEALTAYQQARQRYREAGDRAREAAVLRGIGRALTKLGRNDEAATAYGQALDRMREAGDEERAADVERELAALRGQRPWWRKWS